MSKNYDVTIKWHTPDDATVREAVVKTWASSAKLAEKIGLRGALLDGTIPADAIVDEPANEPLRAVADNGQSDGLITGEELQERVDSWECEPEEGKIETEIEEAAADTSVDASEGEQDMPDRFPPGTRVIVQISKRRQALGTVDYRVDARHVRVHLTAAAPRTPSAMFEFRSLTLATDEDWAAVGPGGKPERKPRAAPSGDRKPGKNANLDAAASRGEMPTKPIMTSAANKEQYQKRFDKLEAMAMAGDWDGVRAYEVKGINSYAKMVAAYRYRLLAAHAASAASADEAA